MIRKITLICLLTFVAVCASAQPKAKYGKTEYELGNIAWHTMATTSIKITNAGSKPLEITAVDAGCDCTLLTWSKDPVSPGGSTTLNVIYDAKTLGTFRREIAVTTNAAEEPDYLVLTGCVKTQVSENNPALPYKIDQLSISTELIEFEDAVLGETPSVAINIVNSGKKDYVPEFINMPRWMTYKSYPVIIPPGGSGRITFTLNSNALSAMGLTRTSIYLARYHGDKKHSSNEISVCATLVPKFQKSLMASSDSVVAVPVAVLPAKLPMGKKFGKKRVHGTTYLENTGEAPLHVSALQVYNAGITVVLTNATVEPGEKVALKVTAKSNILQFKEHPRILIITDDPVQPKLSIDLTDEEPEK